MQQRVGVWGASIAKKIERDSKYFREKPLLCFEVYLILLRVEGVPANFEMPI